MTTFCKSFEQLSVAELYEILALRSKVFVVEQNCVYLDPDQNDQKALHCMLYKDNQLVAYTRIFDMDLMYKDYLSIGRVVVNPAFRGFSFGQTIMKYSINECRTRFGNYAIKIGAQSYLDKFYNDLGFKTTGVKYIEDGIPHQHMIFY